MIAERRRCHAGNRPDRVALAATEAPQHRIAQALTITLETISQGILMVDARGRVPVINPRARTCWRCRQGPTAALRTRRGVARHGAGCATTPPAAAARTPGIDRRHGPDAPTPDRQFDVAREDGTVIEVRSHPLPDGGFVHSYTDVTEQRLADARVRYLAHHDTLTGLANRVQLRQRMPDYFRITTPTRHGARSRRS